MRREIAINQSLAMIRDDKEGESSYSYKVKAAKTKDSKRKIVLPDKALEAILYFRQYYTDEDDFVCVNDKNRNHYTRRQVERTMERIVNNSRCRTKTIHHILCGMAMDRFYCRWGRISRSYRSCWDTVMYRLPITCISGSLTGISMMRS